MPDETPLRYTQGDTDPPLVEDLEQQDPDTGVWSPLDVAGKTVRLLGENRTTRRQFGGTATLVVVAPPPGGVAPSRFQYVLQSGDLMDAGEYVYQWEVSAPSGAVRTIPAGDSWREMKVARKLGAAA